MATDDWNQGIGSHDINHVTRGVSLTKAGLNNCVNPISG